MSSSDLPPLSYVVLACIGEGGATTPEIVDMAERGGPFFWTSAASQVYAEPKRLLARGLVRAEKAPGKTRRRTRYTLTAAGRRTLRAWLSEPAPYPRIQHEAAMRLFAGDMIDDAKIVQSLQGLRAETGRLEPALDRLAEDAKRVPHRERYILLELSLARRLLDAHRGWVDEIERELGGDAAARHRTVR